MSKYLGIVKKVSSGMHGTETRITTKSSSNREEIENWKDYYPGCQSIIIEYDEAADIESFFEEFEDFSPKTEEEKAKASELYEKLMGD